MKRIFLLLAIGVALTVPVVAQQSTGSTDSSSKPPHGPDGGPGGGHMGGLTPEEHQQLMADRKAALDANPDLVAEMKAVQDKINAAMIKIDPKVEPLLAKMDAARKQHEGGQGGPGGDGNKPPPPPPGN